MKSRVAIEPGEPTASQINYHLHGDPHRRASALSDVILGGQDGLVNVLGVILGVAAATSDTRLVLVAGLAATFAESVSMGAVAYTSTMAEADIYASERAREYRHVQRIPELERQEIRELYARKGFAGELLERIVETITATPDVWVAVMLAEEHSSRRSAARTPCAQRSSSASRRWSARSSRSLPSSCCPWERACGSRRS